MTQPITTPRHSNVFPDVQRLIRDRLRSFSEFGQLAIIMQYEGDIDTHIDTALSTLRQGYRIGVALLIATPAAEESGRNLPIVRLDPFGVTISAIEDITFNISDEGTGRRALEWATLALCALKGWTPPGCAAPLHGWGSAITLGQSSGQRVIVNLTMRTRIDLPPLRLPGEYGYTDTTPPPARED
jgi:hypothetical protein